MYPPLLQMPSPRNRHRGMADFLAVQSVPMPMYRGLFGSAKCPYAHIRGIFGSAKCLHAHAWGALAVQSVKCQGPKNASMAMAII